MSCRPPLYGAQPSAREFRHVWPPWPPDPFEVPRCAPRDAHLFSDAEPPRRSAPAPTTGKNPDPNVSANQIAQIASRTTYARGRSWLSTDHIERLGVFPAATLRSFWGPLLPARDRTPSARGTPGCGDLNRPIQACQSRTTRERAYFIARYSQFCADMIGTRLRLSASLPDSFEFDGKSRSGVVSEN